MRAPNICGSSNFGESKFAVPFDVVIPHKSDSVLITFNSNVPIDSSRQTIGLVSSFMLYLRN